jgi:hypothetical protein
MTEYTLTDLVRFSVEEKPLDFAQALDSLLADRIGAAVEARKSEVAERLLADDEGEADEGSEMTAEDEERVDDGETSE